MKIIVAVDDQNGMLFNKRRQSQDQKLREYLLRIVGPEKLWMNAYSYKQFSDEKSDCIFVDEDFLEKAEEKDYCFVENIDLHPYENKITEVILCKWNRRYPGDLFFSLNLEGKELLSSEEIKGSSHEKITVEVYQFE